MHLSQIQHSFVNALTCITHCAYSTYTFYQKIPKVIKADLQVLGAAFFFGIGFLGQRAVSISGLGVMACNTFRFGLSALLLASTLPFRTHPSLKAFFPDDNTAIAHAEVSEMMHDDSHNSDHKVTRPMSTAVVLSKLFGSHFASSLTSASRTAIFWGVTLGMSNETAVFDDNMT